MTTERTTGMVADTTEPEDLDNRIRRDFDAGDFDSAASLFIQRYGGGILGFVVGRMGNATAGAEVFSAFTEDFWLGLSGFKWQTSMKGWAYTLARNACYRHLKAVRQQPRQVDLDMGTGFQLEAAKLRSATLKHLKTEVKSKMREIRERLPLDDQMLLILRVDRKLSWNELAVILSGEGDMMTASEKERWSARLRKRFQSVKERLREMAAVEGLLESKG